MSGEIAAVAKNWLTEPRYVGAFKLTSDVFKDYLCNIMLGVGSIVLAVNFLASMGTGPINCMLKSTDVISGMATMAMAMPTILRTHHPVTEWR